MMTADLCEAELPILIALHLLGKCNATVSEVHCQNFNRIWSCAKRRPNFIRIYDLGEVKLRHILIALSGIRGFTRGPNVSPALE
jgi:hypothetical protein